MWNSHEEQRDECSRDRGFFQKWVLYFGKCSKSNLSIRKGLRMNAMLFSYTLTIAFCHKHQQKITCLEFIFSVTNDTELLLCSYLEEHVKVICGCGNTRIILKYLISPVLTWPLVSCIIFLNLYEPSRIPLAPVIFLGFPLVSKPMSWRTPRENGPESMSSHSKRCPKDLRLISYLIQKSVVSSHVQQAEQPRSLGDAVSAYRVISEWTVKLNLENSCSWFRLTSMEQHCRFMMSKLLKDAKPSCLFTVLFFLLKYYK